MGVPKFYRWMSERYPCLSQVIHEYQIPEFDNMYLDMNGIIHPCSHPNDDDAHFRITEKEIFQNIFNYIECVFRLIKPKKVFFMAVDGVAPRAKMNQQRGRRFRHAMDAETQRQEALEKGETLPSEDQFDSNCITPGTEFMCKLHEQLKYFVNKKLSSDPAWQNVKIILSGHNVPGEGEHKIMEYIRHMKNQPDYQPNTRHCLYGLDADLMLLGLASHEVHFSLLREEVKFGKTQKRIATAEEQTFHLLHLSLMREYVDKEFQCLKEPLGQDYNLERIIDDFILLSFLVGNDFIPHLPDLHIHSGSLPIIWKTYKEVRASMKGYLHEDGVLNLENLDMYLGVLSRFDLERFEVQYEDLKWMAGKSEERKEKTEKQSETDRLKEKFGAMMMLDSDEEEQEDSDEEVDMLQNEFKVQKKRYYMEKFSLKKNEVSSFKKQIAFKYVEGLQWILEYYFRGVPSWSWYYPYHYAPYLSDVVEVASMDINLDLADPFSPFQQLMAVLPPGSAKIIPTVLQELYKDDSSVKDFYPPTFDTDLNGKKQEWEAVVLIPFIDEKRLVEAMSAPISRMTDDEKARNSHGPCIEATYDATSTSTYQSSFPGSFPDIHPCLTRIDMKDKHCYRIPAELLKFPFPDASIDPFRMGFPTSSHLPHTAEFTISGCKIFQFASREANCILNIDPQEDRPLTEYTGLLGEVVYVEYPHLVEALVTGVHTETHDYLLEDTCVTKKLAVSSKKDCFKHLKSRECIALKGRWGLEVGDVRVMMRVRKIRGKAPNFAQNGEVTITRHWCEDITWAPGQLVLTNLEMPIPVQEKSQNMTLSKVFPVDAKVFVVANPGYGSLGLVEEVLDSENRVKVRLRVEDEPLLETLKDSILNNQEHWFYSREICGELGISPLMLSKITSTFKIAISNKTGKGTSQLNIGLSLKFANRNLSAPDFARKTDSGSWQYSEPLREVVKSYVEEFPELFEELEVHLKKDMISANDIAAKFGPEFNVRQYLDKVRKFIKTLPGIQNVALVGVGSEVLPSKFLAQLHKELQEHKETTSVHDLVVKVKPRVLFNPNFQNGVLPPDLKADFRLLDRVVNVCSSHCVPFGIKGTIVGIRYSEEQNVDATKYDVLFDEEFIGGGTLGDRSSHLYTMLPFTLMNFSHGTRLKENKTEKPEARAKQKQRGGRSDGYSGRSEGYSGRSEARGGPSEWRGGSRDTYARGKSDRGSCAGDVYTHSGKPDRREILQRTVSSDQSRGNGRPQVARGNNAGGQRRQFTPPESAGSRAPSAGSRAPSAGSRAPSATTAPHVSSDETSDEEHLNSSERQHGMVGRQMSYPSAAGLQQKPFYRAPGPFPPLMAGGQYGYAPYQGYGGTTPQFLPDMSYMSHYNIPHMPGYGTGGRMRMPGAPYMPYQQSYPRQYVPYPQQGGPPYPPQAGQPYPGQSGPPFPQPGVQPYPQMFVPAERGSWGHQGMSRSGRGRSRGGYRGRQKEAQYEEDFYHGDFYGQPQSGGPADPYLEQSGKNKNRVSPGGTHYYE